jgi:colanic acid biosynthesis glycosyl transferase WcaI
VDDSHLRVAILGINYAPEKSGIAPYTTGLARGLVDAGHFVRVLTSRPHYPEWQVPEDYRHGRDREIVDGVHVRRLTHYMPSKPTGARRTLFELAYGAGVSTAAWGHPDVVICVSPALLSSAAAIARARTLQHRPAVGLIVQDLYSRGVVETGMGGGPLSRAATRLESSVLQSCDGVVAIHDRFKRQMVERLGVDEARISVIRNWTHVPPIENFNQAGFRREMGWEPDETIVLHAGAMGAKQALENVVEAARLADATNSHIRFVLLGDGSRRRSLEDLADGVKSIQFLDPLEAEGFGRALRTADVLLVNEKPGVTEMAVPSKLTSYFSSCRPVLAATDAGSTTAEEIAASGGGIRVDAGNPAALLAAAQRLALDHEEAAALGENGKRYCLDVLSESHAIRDYDHWVRGLAANRNAEKNAEKAAYV